MIRHRWLARSRAIVHSIGWRGSPSLHRAALSSRERGGALTILEIPHGRRPRLVPFELDRGRRELDRLDHRQLVALKRLRLLVAVELQGAQAARFGDRLDVTSRVIPEDAHRRDKRGSARTIGATCSGVTKRGVFSTKMNPRASAPASTAVSASSTFVIPQILTLIFSAWGGETPPHVPPGSRCARSTRRAHVPPGSRCACSTRRGSVPPGSRSACSGGGSRGGIIHAPPGRVASTRDLRGDVAGAYERLSISTAWAPAETTRRTSAPVKKPLSLTTMGPGGIAGKSSSVVSRRVRKVARSRLLIPRTRLPAVTAWSRSGPCDIPPARRARGPSRRRANHPAVAAPGSRRSAARRRRLRRAIPRAGTRR